tara:strand:- start:9 stop:716 length:708 start_codon:yes stop_codon:yes gene_type:complete
MNNNNKYIDWKNWSQDSFAKTTKLEEFYFDNIIKLLKLKKSSKILEIGFGNGSFLGYAISKNYSYVGIESNEKLVNLAISNNFSAFTSLKQINKKDKYDLIILLDVLEHILPDKVEDFFTEINLFLEQNGSIFLRFPNGSSPLGLGNQHGDSTHCNIITIPKLDFWCFNSGLKVESYRGDKRPFIFRHNILKMPSRIVKLFLHIVTEKYIRIISNQSKGILSSNLEVVVKKIDEN